MQRKPADARRSEIARAALKVIAEQGLGRFTALAIAREVGLSDGALFRHFPTKEAIVAAAIDRVEEVLFQDFPPAGPDPLARLGAFFRQRIALVKENPGISRLVLSDELARAAPPEATERVAGFRRRSAGFVRDCLADAARARQLAPGIAPAEASVVVLGSLMALAHGGGLAAPDEPADVLAERVWRTLESFLRRRAAHRLSRAAAPRTRLPHPRTSGPPTRARRKENP